MSCRSTGPSSFLERANVAGRAGPGSVCLPERRELEIIWIADSMPNDVVTVLAVDTFPVAVCACVRPDKGNPRAGTAHACDQESGGRYGTVRQTVFERPGLDSPAAGHLQG